MSFIMAKNIIGNNDGPGGRNDTVNIPGRGTNIPIETINKEIEKGKHPNFTTTEINGKIYPKAKPNPKTEDNVNRK